jgi:RNA polymerase sigma factor (sigma-70 family)
MMRYSNYETTGGFLIEEYMAEVSQYPLLTREQERDFGNGARRGDLEARTIMINSNLKLVVKIAKHYSTITGVPVMDLIQEGNIGLMRAVEIFNPKKAKFSTYASGWIKSKIKKYITTKGYGVKKPANRGDLRFEFISFDAPKKDSEGEDDREMYERTPSGEPTPLEHIFDKNRLDIINESLGILNEKDRMIVEMFFDINQRRDYSRVEIAKKFGVVRQAIERRIAYKILPKLRKHLEGNSYRAKFNDI